jgi:hypothetical protein
MSWKVAAALWLQNQQLKGRSTFTKLQTSLIIEPTHCVGYISGDEILTKDMSTNQPGQTAKMKSNIPETK